MCPVLLTIRTSPAGISTITRRTAGARKADSKWCVTTRSAYADMLTRRMTLAKSVLRMSGETKELGKGFPQLLQLRPRDVADRDVGEADATPRNDRHLGNSSNSRHVAGEGEDGDPVGAFGDEQVGAGLPVPEDDAPSGDAERRLGKVGNVDCERHASLEPRLDGMPVSRDDVDRLRAGDDGRVHVDQLARRVAAAEVDGRKDRDDRDGRCEQQPRRLTTPPNASGCCMPRQRRNRPLHLYDREHFIRTAQTLGEVRIEIELAV